MSECHDNIGEAHASKVTQSNGLSVGIKLLLIAVLILTASIIAYNSDMAVEYRIERARLNRDVGALVGHTSRKNPKFTMMALDYLVEIGDPSSIPVIERLVSHPNRAVRRKAIKTLASLLKEEAVPKRLPRVHHPDRTTRSAALESIGVLIGARFSLEHPDASTPGDLESIQAWIRKRQ